MHKPESKSTKAETNKEDKRAGSGKTVHPGPRSRPSSSCIKGGSAGSSSAERRRDAIGKLPGGSKKVKKVLSKMQSEGPIFDIAQDNHGRDSSASGK